MKDYFSWVYFNPQTEKYDTLKSDLILKVNGESRKNQYIASTDLGDFYDKIKTADNELSSLGTDSWINWTINIFIISMMGLTLFILLRKTV